MKIKLFYHFFIFISNLYFLKSFKFYYLYFRYRLRYFLINIQIFSLKNLYSNLNFISVLNFNLSMIFRFFLLYLFLYLFDLYFISFMILDFDQILIHLMDFQVHHLANLSIVINFFNSME
jgi:hypothetical protein